MMPTSHSTLKWSIIHSESAISTWWWRATCPLAWYALLFSTEVSLSAKTIYR